MKKIIFIIFMLSVVAVTGSEEFNQPNESNQKDNASKVKRFDYDDSGNKEAASRESDNPVQGQISMSEQQRTRSSIIITTSHGKVLVDDAQPDSGRSKEIFQLKSPPGQPGQPGQPGGMPQSPSGGNYGRM